jgi:hypothetical protein
MNKIAINHDILPLQGVVQKLTERHHDLHEDFERLLARSQDDPPMAVGRARRLLEVLVTDRYIACNQLTPPFRKQLKPVFNMIEELLKAESITRVEAALCHAIRLEGNRVLHYQPDEPNEPRKMRVAADKLAQTLQKLAEVAETNLLGEHSVYVSCLGEPFATMYRNLQTTVVPLLDQKSMGPFPLAEALVLLFRSTVGQMEPGWLALLARFHQDERLPSRIEPDAEAALRQLRNLGLIEHDKPFLFTPVRSTCVRPTPAGRLLLLLSSEQAMVDLDGLAQEVVQRLVDAAQDQPTLALLERLQRDGRIADHDKEVVRKRLRNLQLVTHSTYFLEEADEVSLTDLGYYVLGRADPD